MSTKSPAPTSATSSRTPSAPNLFAPSRWALAAQPDGTKGSFGAVLLKPWTPRAGGWHEHETLPVGTLIPGNVVSAWPLNNRLAMERTSYVLFFQSQEEADQAFGPATEETDLEEAGTHRVDSVRPLQHRLEGAKLQARRDNMAAARAAKAAKRAATETGMTAQATA